MRLLARGGGFPAGAVLGLTGAAAALAAGRLDLDRLPFTLCAFKALTGLPCASCGSTRALARLSRLDLSGALALNPFFAGIALLVGAWAIADLALLARGRALCLELSARESGRLSLAVVVALAVNWAYLIAAGR